MRCARVIDRTTALGAFLILAVAVGSIASAQIPEAVKQTANQGRSESPPSAELDAKATREGIEKDLARLRERVRIVEAVPVGIKPDEIEAARKSRSMLLFAYEAQLQSLSGIDAHRKARADAERTEQGWSGFKEPAPYSVLLADDLQEQMDIHRSNLALLKSSHGALTVERERFRDRAQAAAETARREAEALERAAPGTDAHALAAWRFAAARDNAASAAELVKLSNFVSREYDEKLALAQTEARFTERKLSAIAGKTAITKADLDEARVRLDKTREQWDRELQTIVAAGSEAAGELDAARKALESLKSQAGDLPSAEQKAQLSLAEARFRSAEIRAESLGQQTRVLSVLATLYTEFVQHAWSHRYAALAAADPEDRQVARARINEMVEYLKAWRSRGVAQQKENRTAIRDQEQRLQVTTDAEIAGYERTALEALQKLDSTLDRQQSIVDRRLGRFGYWQAEFTESMKARSLGDIAGDVFVRLKDVAGDIWGYELLTIEDKVVVGDKTVTTTRGITVGKSVGALLLFLVGLRVVSMLSNGAERLMVRRWRIGEEQGKTMRRWIHAAGILVLLLLTLNLARIPLTVFAFAGGALAIGIGFGTQTLIKNLISGMIVLVERHIRVGDIIEVQGVTGRVTSVDVRSSTVRGFDGVESMIPNSMLLEQKVTNWTLTSAHLRRIVKVGVAYGSPVREVERILLECAGAHDQVLKTPESRVVFEDFGDNALLFGLYIWIDLTPTTNASQVLSDLRFMIETRLTETGIAVPFPQRDIHLNNGKPLQVEVVRPGGTLT